MPIFVRLLVKNVRYRGLSALFFHLRRRETPEVFFCPGHEKGAPKDASITLSDASDKLARRSR